MCLPQTYQGWSLLHRLTCHVRCKLVHLFQMQAVCIISCLQHTWSPCDHFHYKLLRVRTSWFHCICSKTIFQKKYPLYGQVQSNERSTGQSSVDASNPVVLIFSRHNTWQMTNITSCNMPIHLVMVLPWNINEWIQPTVSTVGASSMNETSKINRKNISKVKKYTKHFRLTHKFLDYSVLSWMNILQQMYEKYTQSHFACKCPM